MSNLIEVRKLIADEKAWTKEVYARDANGQEIYYDDAYAVCWCLTGAMGHVGCLDEEYEIVINLIKERGYFDIPDFNDRHTHAEVLELLDETIKLYNQ